MSWGLWHAIRALVDAHAKYNRDAMLKAIEEQRDKHPKPKDSTNG